MASKAFEADQRAAEGVELGSWEREARRISQVFCAIILKLNIGGDPS
jgi:hypothetical protein